MIYLCKIAADCPKNLKICCGTCEDKDTCDVCCSSCGAWESCADLERNEGGMVAFQAAVPDVIRSMTDLLQMKKQIEDQEKAMKQELLAAMEKYGVKAFETDMIKLTYVAPTTRSAIDTAALKKDLPDLAERYTKITSVSASVRITVK